MPLTEEQIARLEALERAASEPPWRSTGHQLDPVYHANVFDPHRAIGGTDWAADATLIAEMRNALPDLLAELRASQAEARRLWEALNTITDEMERQFREGHPNVGLIVDVTNSVRDLLGRPSLDAALNTAPAPAREGP
jgi:hypothetical protein